MKVYVIDDNLVERDANDNVIYKDVFSIIYYERSDFVEETKSKLGPIDWSVDKVVLELTQGDKVITGVPGIELVVDRYYADGKIERIASIMQDPVAIYSLYLHLKEVEEKNPDGIEW